jgi:hypothetical protein
MKIPLKNKNLEIRFSVRRTPNLKKLEKELEDFFGKNEIEGFFIKKFKVEIDVVDYRIVPLEPPIEQWLSGKGIYIGELEKIGKKYGIKHLDFMPGCYHK